MEYLSSLLGIGTDKRTPFINRELYMAPLAAVTSGGRLEALAVRRIPLTRQP